MIEDFRRYAAYADLVGVYEVAQNLGVPRRRVDRWIERGESTGCPRPLRKLKCGSIYSLADWQGWYHLWRLTRGCETWTTHRKADDD